MATFRKRYRDSMVQQAGIAVFICGEKDGAAMGALVTAEGVLEEFDSARRLGRVVIPIGATGSAAAEIWGQINRSDYVPAGLTKKDFNYLNDPNQTADSLAKIVGKAITAIDKANPLKRKRGRT